MRGGLSGVGWASLGGIGRGGPGGGMDKGGGRRGARGGVVARGVSEASCQCCVQCKVVGGRPRMGVEMATVEL